MNSTIRSFKEHFEKDVASGKAVLGIVEKNDVPRDPAFEEERKMELAQKWAKAVEELDNAYN